MSTHETLFQFLPKETIVQCIEEAFDKLQHGHFKDIPLSSLEVSKQVVCGLFHELIVHEISSLSGWRSGKQKIEADLVHTNGIQLQIKTSSSPDGIAGNRYSSQNQYTDPSEFYICVNFSPFRNISKIRAGFVPSDSWKPQQGKGNAASLKKEVLDALPFLSGSYIQSLPLFCIAGIGEKTTEKLTNKGFSYVRDIHTIDDLALVKKMIKKDSTSKILEEYIKI